MPDAEEETLHDIILSCITKTRTTAEDELWAKFQRVCRDKHIVPLWGQLRSALEVGFSARATSAAKALASAGREETNISTTFRAAARFCSTNTRIYDFSDCLYCGACYGICLGEPKACKVTACLACHTTQCMVNGLARGQCSICLVGLLPGWSGTDRVCDYKGCGKKAVARCDGPNKNRCPYHLEKGKWDTVYADSLDRRWRRWSRNSSSQAAREQLAADTALAVVLAEQGHRHAPGASPGSPPPCDRPSRLSSSRKITSSTQYGPFSMPQCPRVAARFRRLAPAATDVVSDLEGFLAAFPGWSETHGRWLASPPSLAAYAAVPGWTTPGTRAPHSDRDHAVHEPTRPARSRQSRQRRPPRCWRCYRLPR